MPAGGGRRALRGVLAHHRHQARVDHNVRAFRGHRLVGHRGHGQATASRRHLDDTFLELGEIAPGLVLGGVAVYLTSKVVRAQLRHLNKTRIIIAARPSPDAAQASTELWCFPWDTAIQRARPGKDPFARVFEYLHTSLHQQGVLLAPPRLIDGEELPEDHPLAPDNLNRMRGNNFTSLASVFSRKEQR